MFQVLAKLFSMATTRYSS